MSRRATKGPYQNVRYCEWVNTKMRLSVYQNRHNYIRPCERVDYKMRTIFNQSESVCCFGVVKSGVKDAVTTLLCWCA